MPSGGEQLVDEEESETPSEALERVNAGAETRYDLANDKDGSPSLIVAAKWLLEKVTYENQKAQTMTKKNGQVHRRGAPPYVRRKNMLTFVSAAPLPFAFAGVTA